MGRPRTVWWSDMPSTVTSVDVIAPCKTWERRMRCKEAALKPFDGTLRVKARPVAPDQRPEASLAWWWGNPPCEA